MNCKKCGSPLTAEDQFCKNCGASVNEVNAQPTQNYNTINNAGTTPVNNVSTQNYNNANSMPTNNGYGTMPTPNQNMPYPSQQSNNSSKSNMPIIIIGIVAVLAIVILAIVLVPKFLNGGNNGNSGNNSGSGTVNTGGNTVTPTSSSTYKVNYGGFTFKIPDNMMYEVSGDELMLGDEDGTWVVELMIADGSFNQIKNNKSMLQSYFQQNGFTSKPAEVKSLGGSEFVTLEMAKSGVNFVGAYAKLNSMKTAWMIAYNQDNSYDYDILKNMASIISTATYNDASNSIATTPKFNFNINELSEFAQ